MYGGGRTEKNVIKGEEWMKRVGKRNFEKGRVF